MENAVAGLPSSRETLMQELDKLRLEGPAFAQEDSVAEERRQEIVRTQSREIADMACRSAFEYAESVAPIKKTREPESVRQPDTFTGSSASTELEDLVGAYVKNLTIGTPSASSTTQHLA